MNVRPIAPLSAFQSNMAQREFTSCVRSNSVRIGFSSVVSFLLLFVVSGLIRWFRPKCVCCKGMKSQWAELKRKRRNFYLRLWSLIHVWCVLIAVIRLGWFKINDKPEFTLCSVRSYIGRVFGSCKNRQISRSPSQRLYHHSTWIELKCRFIDRMRCVFVCVSFLSSYLPFSFIIFIM